MAITKTTREELYRLVWSQPIHVLSKTFGLSDVGVAKLCRHRRPRLPGIAFLRVPRYPHAASPPRSLAFQRRVEQERQ